MTLPRAHLFCFSLRVFYFVSFLLPFFCFLLCLFVGFHYFIFQFFTISFKSIQLWRSPIRIGTFPFGWPPVHLAGMSLNIARSSSASRVHRGPPFSSLMFPLSSAQVLLPCPSAFTVSICAAFCIFPLALVAFHLAIFSTYHVEPSNLHWFLPCVLHLSSVPLSKLHLLFLFFFY